MHILSELISGDKQHVMFECPALQGVTDRYNIVLMA